MEGLKRDKRTDRKGGCEERQVRREESSVGRERAAGRRPRRRRRGCPEVSAGPERALGPAQAPLRSAPGAQDLVVGFQGGA